MKEYIRKSALPLSRMAMFIDEHLKDVTEIDQNPDIERLIFEYLYWIAFALSYRKGFFRKGSYYYSDFAVYCASDLYMSLRNKTRYANQIYKGREVKPIKSSLNYIKSVLYPLKVNYQRQNFSDIINPQIGHDTAKLEMILKDSIQSQYAMPEKEAFNEALTYLPNKIRKVIRNTPFRNDPVMCKRLYLSIAITLLYQVTLPTKFNNKIHKKEDWDSKVMNKYLNAFRINDDSAITWHLDESWQNYIKILVIRVKKLFSLSVQYYVHSEDLSEEALDSILRSSLVLNEDYVDAEGE